MLSFKRLLQHAMIGAVACTSATQASTILIGDDLELQSAAFDELFDNCGGCAPGDFSDVDLTMIHDSILTSGIDTNAVITVLPVETSNGLALMLLVDQPGGNGAGEQSSVSLTSTAPGSASYFINDVSSDLLGYFQSATGRQTVYGDFTWNADGSADAFAWGNLNAGDLMTMLLTANDGAPSTFPGLNPTDNIQFLSWSGSSWGVEDTAEFNDGGTYAFTALVLPAPGVLAMLTLAGVTTRRRRRSA